MTEAKLGYGAILEVGNESTYTGSSTFVPIAEIRNISGPSIEVSEVDVTNMDSASSYREFIFGLKDPGEISFDLNYETNQYSTLLALLGVDKGYKLTLSDGGVIGIDGFLKTEGLEVPVDDAMTISAAIRIRGAISFTEGS